MEEKKLLTIEWILKFEANSGRCLMEEHFVEILTLSIAKKKKKKKKKGKF